MKVKTIARRVWSAVAWSTLFIFISGAPGIAGSISGDLTTSFSTYSDLTVIGATVSVPDAGISTQSDANGSFTLTGVPEEEVTLKIQAEGLAILYHTVDLSSDPNISELALAMTPLFGDSNRNGVIELDDALDVLQEVAAQ